METAELITALMVLERMPRYVAHIVTGLTPSQLLAKPDAELFALTEHICHLRDIEVEGYQTRIQRILDESNPQLPDINGTKLAIEREYLSQDPAAALHAFSQARELNCARLRALTDDQLKLSGEMEGMGPLTMAKLVEQMCEHDNAHAHEMKTQRDQILAIGAVGSAQ
jgi:DinB superfamily